MKQFIIVISMLYSVNSMAQETVYPATPQEHTIVISNAVIHIGNGQVINNASIEFTKGKITQVGANITVASDAEIVNAEGKHVYPGLIMSATNLGLVEVPSVRATNDVAEIGELNPSVRSIVAYNTDSKVINILRSQGILLANIVPLGTGITGTSSVVHLDAWNWEDAVYKIDHGIHFMMPSLLPRPRQSALISSVPQTDPVKEGLERIDRIKTFLQDAKAYNSEPTNAVTNLKLSAAKGLFDKTQKLFVHANTVKQMLIAMDMVKDLNIDLVIVGGSDSWQIADLLKQKNVSVVLNRPHTLPMLEDDDVDQPYKTPSILQKAGVLFSITDDDETTRGRNLSYNAGTAVAFGLSKEQALQSITLNAAKILGIANKTGSLEIGKDANIVISTGDILDMRTSIVTKAFVQGRQLNLSDKQKQLYERYKYKYGLK